MTRTRSMMNATGAAFVLARKDLRVAMSYRLSFLLGYFTVAFSIVIFYFLAKVVGQGSQVVGSPEDYFRFLIVGLIVGGLVDSAMSAAVGAARRDQMQGTLEAVVSLPVGTATLGLGWLLWPTVSMLIASAIAIGMALPLGFWGVTPAWGGLVVTLVLIILLFSAIGLFGAALVIAFQQGSGAVTIVMTALGVISGSLFPTSVMPDWLQLVAEASPVKHALVAARATALEGQGLADAWRSIVTLAGFTAVLLPIGLSCLEWSLRRARKTGSLGKF